MSVFRGGTSAVLVFESVEVEGGVKDGGEALRAQIEGLRGRCGGGQRLWHCITQRRTLHRYGLQIKLNPDEN